MLKFLLALATLTVFSPSAVAVTSQELYATPRIGLFFYSESELSAPAIPGEPNAYFDPAKPTFIYVHGWSSGEVTRPKARTFDVHRDFPAAPDLDLVKLWRQRGWNFGMLDWAQFADTDLDRYDPFDPDQFLYLRAERRIWTTDANGSLLYHLSNGQEQSYPAASASDVLAASYFAFMNPVARPGLEVRMQGQSLGGQMVIVVAHRLLSMGTAAQPLNPAIIPSRIATTDLTSNPEPRPWLAPATPVGGEERPEGIKPSDRLRTYVQDLKASPAATVFEAYRCSLMAKSGLSGDLEEQLYQEMALTEMLPNLPPLDQVGQHQFCMWQYLASLAAPVPEVVTVTPKAWSTDRCQDQAGRPNLVKGLSAASPTAEVRKAMDHSLRFYQTFASVGTAGEKTFRMICDVQ